MAVFVLAVTVEGAGLGLHPGLAHVELLPAVVGLQDGGVDAEMVPGAEDGDLHVAVTGPG